MCDENNNKFFAPLVFLSEKNPEDIILGETPIILSTGSQFEAKVFSGPNVNLCKNNAEKAIPQLTTFSMHCGVVFPEGIVSYEKRDRLLTLLRRVAAHTAVHYIVRCVVFLPLKLLLPVTPKIVLPFSFYS